MIDAISSWFSPGALLRLLLARRGTIETPLLGEAVRDLELIRETRRRTRLLLADARALQLLVCVRSARSRDGEMAEAGVLDGGSARLICEAKGDAPLHLFDLFDRPAAPDELAAGASVRTHFGGVRGSRLRVEALLADYGGVTLHEGLFPATAPVVADRRFSFIHLDLDLPESMRAALEFFYPRLVPGGIILGDDFYDPDLRETFAAFFAGKRDTLLDLPWGQVMIVRQPD